MCRHEVLRGDVADRVDVPPGRLRRAVDEPEDLERDGRAKQKSFQAAVDKAIGWSTAEHLKREGELADDFRKRGLDVYPPDIDAFRTYAQKVYLASDEAKAWAPGILEKIAAVK